MNLMFSVICAIVVWGSVGIGYIDNNTGVITTMLIITNQWLGYIHEKLCEILHKRPNS